MHFNRGSRPARLLRCPRPPAAPSAASRSSPRTTRETVDADPRRRPGGPRRDHPRRRPGGDPDGVRPGRRHGLRARLDRQPDDADPGDRRPDVHHGHDRRRDRARPVGLQHVDELPGGGHPRPRPPGRRPGGADDRLPGDHGPRRARATGTTSGRPTTRSCARRSSSRSRLDEASAKVSSGPPEDEAEDLALPHLGR